MYEHYGSETWINNARIQEVEIKEIPKPSTAYDG